MERFDVIVIGGGHAGIEAAWAASHFNLSVGLITSNPERIGLMPCNPAVGGPGKSQLVAEIEALGGLMGKLADATAIHTRVLNQSRGPAVQSLRIQVDRDLYAVQAQETLNKVDNIEFVRAEVAGLWLEDGVLRGVECVDGRQFESKSVVVCSGTFLKGVVWYGRQSREAGRQGEPPARFLSNGLTSVGHKLLRFKTGTPPRIQADSVDFTLLEVVPAETPAQSFSGTVGEHAEKLPTWQTRTTLATHELIQANLHLSPMYGGDIEGVGPRYCPSIEDKVVRFADKDTHLLFVEPDGLGTTELYLQGFSSSLPPELQVKMVQSLPGFENAVIQRYAYAVEYDAVNPMELTTGLQSRFQKGLFTAGQLNGTSGYEEAAAQGLVAGLNAARFAMGLSEVSFARDSGYIGVLIDDLVHRGIDEPYRMMTSRVELRLLCRSDNADERLSELGFELGLIDSATMDKVRDKYQRVEKEIHRLEKTRHNGQSAAAWLRRPEISYLQVLEWIGIGEELAPIEKTQVETKVKYAGYITRQAKLRERLKELDNYLIPTDLDFARVHSLSTEAIQKMRKLSPKTVAEASRIPGVRDSDLTALLVHLTKAVA